jgi:RimJ/RimL family protein N-acetyltransferase
VDPIHNQQERDDGLPRGGGNCLLRRLSAEDLLLFQAYRSDPEVGRYQGWEPMDDAVAAFTGAIGLVFERTAAERLVAITDSRNTPSIRLLERVGMVRERSYQTRFRGEACVELEFSLSRGAVVLKTDEVHAR